MHDRLSTSRLHQWVVVQQDAYAYTARMRVPGGFLYRYEAGTPAPPVMTFVPDRRVEATPLPAGQPDRRRAIPID